MGRHYFFGLVNSAIVDRPFACLIFSIDLDETPIPLNLITIVVSVALDWSNDDGLDANNGREDADVLLLKVLRSHSEKRALFVNTVAYR